MAAGVKGADKWKEKKWFNIQVPEVLGSMTIGEMPATDEKSVVGRVIKVSMSWITNNMSHSFTVVGLKVTDVTGNAAHTQLKYFEQTYSYLHSLAKRHSSIVYTVDKLSDKDGKKIVLKLMLVTGDKTTTPKLRALRRVISDFAKSYTASKTREALIKDIIDTTFQRECMKQVQNIVRLSKLEVKRLEL